MCTGLISLLLATTCTGATCEFIGINQDFVWTDPAKVSALVAYLRNTGVRWVRLPLRWNMVQPQPGPFDWSRTDPVVHALHRNGIRMLGLLVSVPAWANGTTPGKTEGWYDAYPPLSLDDWAEYARAVGERYGDTIRHWEIWNEQNGVDFFRPMPDVHQYVPLLQRAYSTLKAVHPDCVVLMGGLQMNGILANPWSPVRVENYLQQMYDAGARGFYDAVNIHPYIVETDPAERIVEMVHGTIAVMTRNGETDLPIWITEVGVPARVDPSGELQARNLEETLVQLHDLPQVEKVFWFCLQDYEHDIVGPEAAMGVLTRDLAEKPASRSLRAACRVCEQVWEARPPVER